MSKLLKESLYSSKFKEMDNEMKQILKYFKHSDIAFYKKLKPFKTPLQAVLSSLFISLAEILYNGPTRVQTNKQTKIKERQILASFGTVAIALLGFYRKDIMISSLNAIEYVIEQLQHEENVEMIMRRSCDLLERLEHNGK
jgi:hypothetical protein